MHAHLKRILFSFVALLFTLTAGLASAATPANCTVTQLARCADRGGTPVSYNGACACQITTYTPRTVTNVLKGDVGLVPVHDGKGEETVRAVMSALVQNHRHTVVFLSSSEVIHNTSYDDMQAALQEWRLRLDPAVLMNGTPGVERRSVDSTYSRERISDEGLILKPGHEILRPYFHSGADEALADVGRAYYKISDYTSLDGMSLSYSSDRSVDRRGTMCSGTVYEAYTRAGMVITTHTYPEWLRNRVAQAVYDSVFDQVPWAAGIVGLRNRIANQVTNCFGGFGCDDTSDTWTSGAGSGTTIAPDNLLPQDFTIAASTAYTDTGTTGYQWRRRLSSSVVATSYVDPGDEVLSSQRCTSSSCVSYGASTTPFLKVELQNLVGGEYRTVILLDF